MNFIRIAFLGIITKKFIQKYPVKHMSYDWKKIRKKVEKSQDKSRFEHTLGVAYTAAMLARLYDVDEEDALVAGYLHDCAKCMDHEEKLRICKKHNIPVREIERRNPFLLHAKVGSFVAQKEYDIQNQDILNAITYHTTGRPEMTMLEKNIFISDYIEPGRTHAANLSVVRKLAFSDIDQALLKILGDSLAYLHTTGKEIDDLTQKTFDYYANNVSQ